MEREIWKDIPDYEGEYQVSNKGRVRSLDRTRTVKDAHGGYMTRTDRGKIMRPCDNGYRLYIRQLGITKFFAEIDTAIAYRNEVMQTWRESASYVEGTGVMTP